MPITVLDQAIAQNSTWFAKHGAVAVGLSGGPDSAALAISAARWAQQQSRRLYFFHIHHGLQVPAEQWAQQARALGRLLAVPTWVRYVQVQNRGDGTESAARRARYQALAQMAQEVGVGTVLLAHHRDDQAETVLMRLLRGSGPEGLAAMRVLSRRQGIHFVRPFINVPRKTLLAAVQEFSSQTHWQPVIDPTNLDPQYARGVIRTQLAPHLTAHWPQWQNNLARHAELAAEQSALLSEWATELLQQLDYHPDEPSFSLASWRKLSAAQQTLVLRHFLEQAGTRMPSRARVLEMQRQLQQVHQLGTDRQLQIKHDRWFLRCERGRVLLKPYEGG